MPQMRREYGPALGNRLKRKSVPLNPPERVDHRVPGACAGKAMQSRIARQSRIIGRPGFQSQLLGSRSQGPPNRGSRIQRRPRHKDARCTTTPCSATYGIRCSTYSSRCHSRTASIRGGIATQLLRLQPASALRSHRCWSCLAIDAIGNRFAADGRRRSARQIPIRQNPAQSSCAMRSGGDSAAPQPARSNQT